MSYLQKLIQDKKNREKWEKEQELLKACITDINQIFSIKDGEFVQDLSQFVNKWK